MLLTIYWNASLLWMTARSAIGYRGMDCNTMYRETIKTALNNNIGLYMTHDSRNIVWHL